MNPSDPTAPKSIREHKWECVAPGTYYYWACKNPGCGKTLPYPCPKSRMCEFNTECHGRVAEPSAPAEPSHIVKNRSTPENAAFWDHVEKVSQRVSTSPEFRKHETPVAPANSAAREWLEKELADPKSMIACKWLSRVAEEDGVLDYLVMLLSRFASAERQRVAKLVAALREIGIYPLVNADFPFKIINTLQRKALAALAAYEKGKRNATNSM